LLCPEIHRQRLIIEGHFEVDSINDAFVQGFLTELTGVMGMTPLSDPVIFSPDAVSEMHHGVGGFQPWAESGCSLYTWRDKKFFTLDVYSCKPYDVERLVSWVKTRLNTDNLQWRDA